MSITATYDVPKTGIKPRPMDRIYTDEQRQWVIEAVVNRDDGKDLSPDACYGELQTIFSGENPNEIIEAVLLDEGLDPKQYVIQ